MKDDDSFASPTASLEAIMTFLMIDAYDGFDVALVDVPGAYLHAEFPKDKRVVLKLNGIFVEIMCEVNPEYHGHIVYETSKKGKRAKCLYMCVLRALYGCLESALLWYELYSSTLCKMGFKLNDYNRCVGNKVIDGEQCAIVFYVDDNKISHKNPQVVHIGMKGQISDVLDWGGKQKGHMPATPAKATLFVQEDDEQALNENGADTFHSVVQKLMYICKRARPDIEPALSYLSTKVSSPTVNNQEKLDRLLDFIRGTANDRQTIGADSLEEMITWVDTSFAPTYEQKKSYWRGDILWSWCCPCKVFQTKIDHQEFY